MRTMMSVVAAIWFGGAAIVIGDGSSGLLGDPPNQEVIGDPTVIAIHLVARVLFVGLALFAMAFADGPALVTFFSLPKRDVDQRRPE